MMIKQNPMNEFVKVSCQGSIDIVEMAPSQLSDLTSELFEGIDNWKERKVIRKRFYIDRESFTLSNGQTIKVIDPAEFGRAPWERI